MNKIAINLFEGEGFRGFGPLGLEGRDTSQGISIFAKFISSAIGLITLVALIWFVLTIILGAVGIIASGGDKAALEGAKKKMSNGLLGIVVVVLSLIIVSFIGYLLGIDILNLEVLFDQLQI